MTARKLALTSLPGVRIDENSRPRLIGHAAILALLVVAALAGGALPSYGAPAGPVAAEPGLVVAPVLTVPAGPAQSVTDVAVVEGAFDPNMVTIPVGAIVRWTSRGVAVHSTTSDDLRPDGQPLWSWALMPGSSFYVRFLAPGTYRYHCLYHPDVRGTVVVTAGVLPTPTPTSGVPPGPGSGSIVFDDLPEGASLALTDLYVVQPDGSGRQRIADTADLIEAQPSWAPDRRRVAYTASSGVRGDPWSLWVLDVVTGERHAITAGPEHYEPDWKPDGSQIAFIRVGRVGGVATSSEIGVVAPDGSGYRGLVRLDSQSYGVVNPAWSPDGTRLAFTLASNAVGGELYLTNADGSDVRQLFSHPGWDDIEPAWSPNGRYIAFVSGVNRGSLTRHDVWVADLVRGVAGTVAQHPDWDLRGPTWSPDSTLVAFSARPSGMDHWALYLVPATGGPVSGPLGTGMEPDWGGAPSVLPTVVPVPTATPGAPPTFPPPPTAVPTQPGPTNTAAPPPTFPPPEDTPTSWPSPTLPPFIVRGQAFIVLAYRP
jgi:Tol biopolymer transport system component/plastocyanin